MTKQEKNLETLLAPVVNGLGYELYDVEFVKEGKDYYLRLFIDNEKGIDLDDCEKVSGAVGDALDEADPIEVSYSLEVSSCGLERRIRERKHFEAALSKNVEIKVYKAIDKEKIFAGTLEKIDENTVTVEVEGKKVDIEFSNISNAKILFNWEE